MGIFNIDYDTLHDEQPAEGEFTNLPAGDYLVNGVSKIITEDESGVPFFAPDSLSDQLVARVVLRLTGGESGPAWSASVADLVVFAEKMGIDIRTLAPYEPTAGFLQRVINAVNTGARRPLKVSLNGKSNWVNKIPSFCPPTGEYMFRFVDAYSIPQTDPLTFVDGQFGRQMQMSWEIVADRFGEPTPYAGFRIQEPFYDPFDGYQIDEAGVVQFKPMRTENGYKIEFLRWRRFLAYFAPTREDGSPWSEESWETDPTRSAYGVNEAEFHMVPMVAAARAHSNVVRGTLEQTSGAKSSGRPKVDLMKFDSDGAPTGETVRQVEDDMGDQSPELAELVAAIERLGKQEGIKIFEPTAPGAANINLQLTAEGIAWCKAHLVENNLWANLNLPVVEGTRRLRDLSPEQATSLRAELMKGAVEVNATDVF